jgi:hypothetical protein
MNSIHEPAKHVRILAEADVVVAGAGVSGVFAAIAAARCGVRTVLVEKFGSVGGNIGPGMINNGGMTAGSPHPDVGYDKTVYPGMYGIAQEFIHRYAELGGGSMAPYHTRPFDFATDAQIASYTAQRMLEESGVQLILGATAADPVMDGDVVNGIYIEASSERTAVLAKIVIDATGDAAIARRAGAPMLQPEQADKEVDAHSPVGMGLHYIVGGIDWNTWQRFFEESQPSADEIDWAVETFGTDKLGIWQPMLSMLRTAIERGNLATALSIPLSETMSVDARMSGFSSVGGESVGQGHIQPERTDKIDMNDTMHMSALEAGLRRQIMETVLFLRDHAPGMENARVLSIAPFLGARGGPCVDGEYTLTMDDCRAGAQFEDVIYRYGEFRALRWTAERGEVKWADVPYRVMVPKRVDGLLCTGRAASGKPDTLLRNRWAVKIMGEACGIAAALCVEGESTPRNLNRKTLQAALLDAGFNLGDRTRLNELGLM